MTQRIGNGAFSISTKMTKESSLPKGINMQDGL
jgi:hypothetical protein